MTSAPPPQTDRRLNLLLSYGGWRDESWADQLPRLLSPLGVQSIKVDSGREAEDVIRQTPVHIAVIDMSIPLDDVQPNEPHKPAGAKVLRLLRRLSPVPPIVAVRRPEPVESERVRALSQALREGAFTVVDQPVNLEIMLQIMQRILKRYYADVWPNN